MATIIELPVKLAGHLYTTAMEMPLPLLLSVILSTVTATFVLAYFTLVLLAPTPRPPFASEKLYITSSPSSKSTPAKALSCWYDAWLSHRDRDIAHTGAIEPAEVEMSVVIPAYNEEARLEIMLEEAVEFLDAEYGRKPHAQATKEKTKANNSAKKQAKGLGGYEILIVNDGSKDKTVNVALDFATRNGLHDVLRICTLKENRGKGGAVTHGMRHVRGNWAVFADADGASKFGDLRKLVEGAERVADTDGRAIGVGSRAHLVGSEAVVKRSALRNTLMHSFHLLLRLLTPPATSRIRDTQCGFKLFSRSSLPHIIPYMHAEGWIFDVEMLMLAESAPCAHGKTPSHGKGIRIAEVPIGWKEVDGSKLNVMWDSLGMAYGLALLRAGWLVGVYRRR